MGFCQPFRYFSDRIKCTQVAEIKPTQCIIIQAIFSQKLMKKVTVLNDQQNWCLLKLLTIKDTSGMNLRTLPSVWTKVVSIERKISKIRLCTKKSTLLVYERKYLVSASFLLFNKAMPIPLVNSF